ncbi:serine/threonine protein kinase [Histoplasma capsulatum var. duboisii H88]|uniref:Serine/threonine protein kinase n=1 Tax=Ajellomyces capsulatus (strain H88) TaxID=544711 RepID=F0UIV4_AJEC8|nr:serine/threonine protein kinase [Histoplasma capsulatum var. duboisii H88]
MSVGKSEATAIIQNANCSYHSIVCPVHLIHSVGQSLKGRTGLYTVTKQLQDCVWLATNQQQEKVVAKSVCHFRLQNERDILLHFQNRTPFVRPLIDEIQDSSVPPTLILRYLDDDVLRASGRQRLTRIEVIDLKPSNVLVNYGHGNIRFKDIQLADFGSTVREDSAHARDGDPIGTPIFRSPEAHLQMKWDTATDIWSFGAMARFHIFKPDVPVDHDEYDTKILMKHHRCFGPFPESYEEIADQERLAVLVWIMQNSPPETLRPFHLTTARESEAKSNSIVRSSGPGLESCFIL